MSDDEDTAGQGGLGCQQKRTCVTFGAAPRRTRRAKSGSRRKTASGAVTSPVGAWRRATGRRLRETASLRLTRRALEPRRRGWRADGLRGVALGLTTRQLGGSFRPAVAPWICRLGTSGRAERLQRACRPHQQDVKACFACFCYLQRSMAAREAGSHPSTTASPDRSGWSLSHHPWPERVHSRASWRVHGQLHGQLHSNATRHLFSARRSYLFACPYWPVIRPPSKA